VAETSAAMEDGDHVPREEVAGDAA
jgi:hypothetical protein